MHPSIDENVLFRFKQLDIYKMTVLLYVRDIVIQFECVLRSWCILTLLALCF